MQEAQVWSLGQEDPLEQVMANHSSILAWRIPRTEEPGAPQFMGVTKNRTRLSDSVSQVFQGRFQDTKEHLPRWKAASNIHPLGMGDGERRGVMLRKGCFISHTLGKEDWLLDVEAVPPEASVTGPRSRSYQESDWEWHSNLSDTQAQGNNH